METMMRKAAIGAILLGTGVVVGAAAGLLLAPQSGRETRRDIARLYRRGRRHAEEAVDEFSGTVKGMAETVGHKAHEILESGKELSREARGRVVKAVEEAAERLEHEREKLAKLAG